MNRLFGLPGAALAWLGRQGTRAVAALVVIGIGVPPLGAAVRPYLSEAVFALLFIAFLRLDVAELKRCLARPGLALAATAWTALVVPLLFGAVCRILGADRSAPELFLGLMLQAIASPMMAAPSLAVIMGLDSTLVLVTLITSTALIPLTAPLFAWLFVGAGLALSPLALAGKLFALLAGAAGAGLVARRIAGVAAIERGRRQIDGINILVLLVFVAAIMEKVAARFIAAPLLTLAYTALAFAVFALILTATSAVFLRAGKRAALSLGFMASQRNMGLMLAATGGLLPDLTWLYFALSQFPIYLSPQMLLPLTRRLLDPDRKRAG